MKRLYVDVQDTVAGITGDTLDMPLSEEKDSNAENVDRLSALFNDVDYTNDEYDLFLDIWNKHTTVLGILNELKAIGLIIDFEIKDEEAKD